MKLPKGYRLASNCGECKYSDGAVDAYYDEYRVTCYKHCIISSELHVCDDWKQGTKEDWDEE